MRRKWNDPRPSEFPIVFLESRLEFIRKWMPMFSEEGSLFSSSWLGLAWFPKRLESIEQYGREKKKGEEQSNGSPFLSVRQTNEIVSQKRWMSQPDGNNALRWIREWRRGEEERDPAPMASSLPLHVAMASGDSLSSWFYYTRSRFTARYGRYWVSLSFAALKLPRWLRNP